jgi:hypothetical protein
MRLESDRRTSIRGVIGGFLPWLGPMPWYRHPTAVIVMTQLLFTTGDLLARVQMKRR